MLTFLAPIGSRRAVAFFDGYRHYITPCSFCRYLLLKSRHRQPHPAAYPIYTDYQPLQNGGYIVMQFSYELKKRKLSKEGTASAFFTILSASYTV